MNFLILKNILFIDRLTFEFPATGGILPFSSFRTVKLLRYVTAWDYFILACELIFCGFIFYYIVEETLEIRKHRYNYFKSVWNILDLTVIIVRIVFSLTKPVSLWEWENHSISVSDIYCVYLFEFIHPRGGWIQAPRFAGSTWSVRRFHFIGDVVQAK